MEFVTRVAHQPPLEIPGKEVQGYMPTNVLYQCELPPEQCHMFSMEGGLCWPDYFGYIPDATQNNSAPVAPMSPTAPQPQPKPTYSRAYLGGAGTSARDSKQPTDDAVKKRIMKNREASKECKRKKKVYVRGLEIRVATLESQTESLMDELRALKQFYELQ